MYLTGLCNADDDMDPSLQRSPSGKGRSKRFIRVGSSRSEDGSPRTTWEDQDDGLIRAGQSRSEDGSPTQDWPLADNMADTGMLKIWPICQDNDAVVSTLACLSV